MSEDVAKEYFADCVDKLAALYAKKERKALLDSFRSETDEEERQAILARLEMTKRN